MHLLRLKKAELYSKLFNVPNLVTLMFDSVNFRLTRSDYNGGISLVKCPVISLMFLSIIMKMVL